MSEKEANAKKICFQTPNKEKENLKKTSLVENTRTLWKKS